MNQKFRRYMIGTRELKKKANNPTMDLFYSNGIKMSRLRKWEGRYFNTIALVKIFICEPIFLTLQMLPGI